MPSPDYRSVFADPASHVDFITVADDSAFEAQHLDRKQASRPDPHGRLSRGDFGKLKELIEATMSAFANADGGVLVLGVTTEGDVAGLDHLSESQINSLLNLTSMVGAVVQVKLHSILVAEDSRRIALFKVDAPERSICHRIKDDAAWIRKGMSTQRLRGAELEQLRRDRRVVDFEMTPSERFEVRDVDTGVLAEFVKSSEVIDDDRDTVQILRNAGAISGDLAPILLL